MSRFSPQDNAARYFRLFTRPFGGWRLALQSGAVLAVFVTLLFMACYPPPRYRATIRFMPEDLRGTNAEQLAVGPLFHVMLLNPEVAALPEVRGASNAEEFLRRSCTARDYLVQITGSSTLPGQTIIRKRECVELVFVGCDEVHAETLGWACRDAFYELFPQRFEPHVQRQLQEFDQLKEELAALIANLKQSQADASTVAEAQERLEVILMDALKLRADSRPRKAPVIVQAPANPPAAALLPLAAVSAFGAPCIVFLVPRYCSLRGQKRWQFDLASLIILMLLVAVALGWWLLLRQYPYWLGADSPEAYACGLQSAGY